MPEDILENFKRNLRRKVHIQPVPHLFCKRLLAVCQAGRIEVAEPDCAVAINIKEDAAAAESSPMSFNKVEFLR